MYPIMRAPWTLASTRNPILEFCMLNRISDRFPCGALLKGMALKLVPILFPVLVVRNTVVKSINPTGVIYADPIRNESGWSSLRLETCRSLLALGFSVDGGTASDLDELSATRGG